MPGLTTIENRLCRPQVQLACRCVWTLLRPTNLEQTTLETAPGVPVRVPAFGNFELLSLAPRALLSLLCRARHASPIASN